MVPSRNRPPVYVSEPIQMNGLQDVDGLSACIGRAIQEHLAKSNISIAWPQLDSLTHPVLRVEAFLEDAGPNTETRAKSERIASVRKSFSYVLTYTDKNIANDGSVGHADSSPYTKPYSISS
jgi:hypothetical protein